MLVLDIGRPRRADVGQIESARRLPFRRHATVFLALDDPIGLPELEILTDIVEVAVHRRFTDTRRPLAIWSFERDIDLIGIEAPTLAEQHLQRLIQIVKHEMDLTLRPKRHGSAADTRQNLGHAVS